MAFNAALARGFCGRKREEGERKAEDVRLRNGHRLRVAAEDRDGDDAVPRADGRDSGADALGHARDLHPGDEGRFRRPRVGAGADEEIGEVESERGRPDEDVAGARRRVLPFVEDEPLRTARPLDEPRSRTHGPLWRPR